MRLLTRVLGALAIAVVALGGEQSHLPNAEWETSAYLSTLALLLVSYLAAFWWEWGGGAGLVVGGALLLILRSLTGDPAMVVAIAPIVPGLLFLLLWQRTAPGRAIGGLVLGTCAVITGAAFAANAVYNHYYGPTHPESAVRERPVDLVEFMWAGALRTDGFQVKAKLAEGVDAPILLVGTDGTFNDPLPIRPASISEHRIVTFNVSGLKPATDYPFTIRDGNRTERERRGRVTTAPEGAASFTFALGACIGTGSNGQVFDRIREANPLLFLVTGDFQYENISTNDAGAFREAYERNLTSPAQQELYLTTAFAYTWDDHDWGGDGSDARSASAPAASAVYREYVPHHQLAGERSPIYQAFTIGRARFIVTDTRAARSPADMDDGPNKTMLGEEQKAWFKQQLLEANGQYPLIIWVNAVPWIAAPADGADHWGNYATERAELANFIAENQIDGLLMLSGDAHAIAIDDGTNSNFSDSAGPAFPVFHAAALDRRGRSKGGPYSHGTYPGGGQFGLVTVTDEGGAITVELSGRNWKGEEVVGYRFQVGE